MPLGITTTTKGNFTMALKIRKHYFTDDGTYGDAREMIILDTSNFTPEEWEWVEEASDGERVRIAITCYVRSFYRIRNESESGLPCEHCCFVEESDTESGYVWITCYADDDNGCDWGNC